jgi:membrane protease YdiL (CAAX protease family)
MTETNPRPGLPGDSVSSDGRSGGPIVVVIASLFAAVIGSVIMAVLGVAIAGGSLAKPTVTNLVFSQVGLWFGLIGGPIVALRMQPSGFANFRARFVEYVGLRFRPNDLLWAALGPVLQVMIGIAYAPFTSSEEVSKVAKDLAARAEGQVIPFVVLGIATAIGAPIVEEVFFRGFFARALTNFRSATDNPVFRPLIAGAITSVVFGLFHFQPLLAPALIFFGAVCAFLTHRYRRLGPAICLHTGFNAHTMIALAFQTF